ncbi:hypothetical protein HY463_00340 [Candidatus Peregrinibacteria bacterium]|nr:hypothetical protein [Candidatus Peregrinibacteria bacterium]
MRTSNTLLGPGEEALYSEHDSNALTTVLECEIWGDTYRYKLRVLAVINDTRMAAADKLVRGSEFIRTIDPLLGNTIVKASTIFDPEELQQIVELEQSGSIKRMEDIIDSRNDVWIKRRSGAWQLGRPRSSELGGNWPLFVEVLWDDAERRRPLMKCVTITECLAWQEEAKQMSAEEMVAFMRNSATIAEWNKKIETIKESFGGLPEFWDAAIMHSGLLDEMSAKFVGDETGAAPTDN